MAAPQKLFNWELAHMFLGHMFLWDALFIVSFILHFQFTDLIEAEIENIQAACVKSTSNSMHFRVFAVFTDLLQPKKCQSDK